MPNEMYGIMALRAFKEVGEGNGAMGPEEEDFIDVIARDLAYCME